MNLQCDIAIIGGGVAGCSAAVEAARAGRKVVLIERNRLIGGAAWHRGRLPAKLLQEATVQRNTPGDQDNKSVEMTRLLPNLEEKRRERSAELAQYLDSLGVVRLHARAKIRSATEVEISTLRGEKRLVRAKNVLLAVGDKTPSMPHVRIDHEVILDIGSALSSVYVPQSAMVVGDGPPAVEIAGLFAHLGAKVSLVVGSDGVLPQSDPAIRRAFVVAFVAAGGQIVRGQSVVSAEKVDGASVRVHLADIATKLETERVVDRVILAHQREPNVRGLGVDTLGLAFTESGWISVDDQFRTSVRGVFAVGAAIGAGSCAPRMSAQARSAVRVAFGLPELSAAGPFVEGILSVPELAQLGESSDAHPLAEVAHDGDDQLGFKLVVRRGLVVGAHTWGDGAEGRLKAVADMVAQRWSVARLLDTTTAVWSEARRAATNLESPRTLPRDAPSEGEGSSFSAA